MSEPAFTSFISGNVPSLKNSKRAFGRGHGKRAIILPSEQHERYKSQSYLAWKSFSRGFCASASLFEKPLVVRFFFVRDSLRRFDLDNATSTCLDLMVKYEWIDDDNADEIIPRYERPAYVKDKNQAGVRIEIHEIDNERKINK